MKQFNDDTENIENEPQNLSSGILDTITYAQNTSTLRDLNPQESVLGFLNNLSDREKQVIIGRYGLGSDGSLTLEQIGKQMQLTRERIRQIEKDSLKKLRNQAVPANLEQIANLIFQTIEQRGNIGKQSHIHHHLLMNNDSDAARMSVGFILQNIPRFNLLAETTEHHTSWYIRGFDKNLMDEVIEISKEILGSKNYLDNTLKIFDKIREQAKNEEVKALSDEILESYMSVSKHIDKNPFNKWGLSGTSEIHPKDVGDKAYLVLANHSEPEHYSRITEMINRQKFDGRLAHKASVHNELIKDGRFVLVGRGIYALKSWGYKKGVVSDIIKDVLNNAGKPLSKEEIISQVLKQRMVKKNTITVGLSNRTLFKKTQDNKYINV